MHQHISFQASSPRATLHVVHEEESPYDASPAKSGGRDWIVMVARQTGLDILAALGPDALAVYWVLQAYADQDGVCFPTREDLSSQTHISMRQVGRALVGLAAHGFIEITHRGGKQGGRIANSYQITARLKAAQAINLTGKEPHRPSTGGLNAAQAINQDDSDGVEGQSRGGLKATQAHQVIATEVKSTLPTGEVKKNVNSLVQNGFDDWYASYPRKQKRIEAEKAWRKLTDAEHAAAAAGLIVFQFSDDPQYIPLPSSWLNGKRWQDQPTIARPNGHAAPVFFTKAEEQSVRSLPAFRRFDDE